MKLSLEEHSALSKMARYFETVEELAERTGLEASALAEEFLVSRQAVNALAKKNSLVVAASRKQHFIEYENFIGRQKDSIINLSVIVNEERF